MKPEDESPSQSFRYDGSPSVEVIEAVAGYKDAAPTSLAPLHGAVEADALDALFDTATNASLSATFEYEGCAVRVTDDGEIVVRDASEDIPDRLERPTSVLLLAPSVGDHRAETCDELLSARRYDRANVLGVTFAPEERDRFDAWNVDGVTPARVSVVSVGSFPHASASSSSESPPAAGRVRVDRVADPGDLPGLATRIDEQLSAWDATDGYPVVCFDSLTDLLREAELEDVFRLLHLLLVRLSSVGALANFHLDTRAHDDETVYTLRPLFDVVVDVGEDGTRTTSVR